jgi:hypothetical protein
MMEPNWFSVKSARNCVVRKGSVSFGKECQRTAAGTGRHGLEENLEIEPFPSSLAEDLNSVGSDPKPQLPGGNRSARKGYLPSIRWKSCRERKPNFWSSGILWAYMQMLAASPSFSTLL